MYDKRVYLRSHTDQGTHLKGLTDKGAFLKVAENEHF